MTITELLMNFRTALLALTPAFERVGIPWQRPDAYDEWDACASALFVALVREPLRALLPESERGLFRLPDYDMLLPTYQGLSVIEILPSHGKGNIRVFHALGTTNEAFDVVEWRCVGRDGQPVSDVLESSPLDGSVFAAKLTRVGT